MQRMVFKEVQENNASNSLLTTVFKVVVIKTT